MFVPKSGRYHRRGARNEYSNAKKQKESEIQNKKRLKVMFVSYLLSASHLVVS